MHPVIIACKTLENELRSAIEHQSCRYPVLWLESGLHNWPDRLRAAVQKRLDGCTDYDTVLLAMSFCGDAVVGLRSGDFRLVIPRCDDCITLLLGSDARRRSISATYFMTEGWLSGENNIWQEYLHCIQKYGEKRGKRIFSAMLAHYKKLALLDTGCFDKDSVQAQLMPIAEALGLKYTCIEGTLDYLQDLLDGNWDPGRFLIVPPRTTISPDMLKG